MNILRHRKALFLLAICFSAMMAGLWLHEAEPKYQGRSLRKWTKVLWAGSPVEQAAAADAVRAIGTNAIPTLERMLRSKDSKLRLAMLELCKKQSFVRYPYLDHGLDRQRLALKAADALGEKARPMVPLLQEIIRGWRAQSLDVVYEASRIAKRFEPETTPDLVGGPGVKPHLVFPTANNNPTP